MVSNLFKSIELFFKGDLVGPLTQKRSVGTDYMFNPDRGGNGDHQLAATVQADGREISHCINVTGLADAERIKEFSSKVLNATYSAIFLDDDAWIDKSSHKEE